MSNNYEVKQVILMRTDLRNTKGEKVRSGKLMAQAAHASMMWLSLRCRRQLAEEQEARESWERSDAFKADPFREQFSAAELHWLGGSFAKIVLAVESEAQLQELVEKANKVYIAAHVVTDAGKTEFGDVPTVTCAAIGPATSDLIDTITGHLRPL